MKSSKDSNKNLILAFNTKKLLTIYEIKSIINSNSRMTAHRHLCRLDYNTSYSHAGRYYTLHSIAKYNRLGLWRFNGVYFSKHGSLSSTIEKFVNNSEQGCFASELRKILKVFVHNELYNLFLKGKIYREQIGNEFLYISPVYSNVQLDNRKSLIQASVKEDLKQYAYKADHIEYLKMFLSILNEKQRRLFLGFESLKLGYGGDTIISKKSGVGIRAISKGRKELLSHNIVPDRIRSKGGGRPSIKKT